MVPHLQPPVLGAVCCSGHVPALGALRERVRDLEEKLRAPIPEGPALRMMALAALKKGVFKDARAEARAKEIAEAILAWSEGK